MAATARRHNEALNAAGIPHKLDVSVPMARLARRRGPTIAGGRGAAGARLILYGHLGDGNLHVNVLGPEPDDEARRRRGPARSSPRTAASISAEHGVGVAKRALARR